jgi:uncharacterized protein (DUF2062 family)
VIESKYRQQVPSYFSRLRNTLKNQLNQGLNPHDLALAFALGSTVGIMPLVWGTSFICVGVASLLKLNQVVVQCGNHLVYPLQILLFIPYLMGANQLFPAGEVPPDTSHIIEMITLNPNLFFQMFWQLNLQALVIWLISSPFWIAGVYLPTFFCYKHFSTKKVKKE